MSDVDAVKKKKRGFGAMDKEKQRKIASAGGKAAHMLRPGKKLGHEWTPEEAYYYGLKGAEATRKKWEERRNG